MQSWTKRTLYCAALAIIPATATAQSSFRQFDVCGGKFAGSSAFGFCAAANVAVQIIAGAPTVTIQVWNESGNAPLGNSPAWTTLIAVGLTNVIPTTVDIVSGSLKVTGPCFTNPQGCDVSQYWGIGNNWNLGGVMIDMLTYSAGSGEIAGSCDPHDPLLTRPGYLITSCDRSGPQFVTISFKVTQDFDLADGGDLFLKGKQQGTGSTTTCVTHIGPVACTPVTPTPEPGTLVLLGSGLSGFTGMGFVRRRRKKDVA